MLLLLLLHLLLVPVKVLVPVLVLIVPVLALLGPARLQQPTVQVRLLLLFVRSCLLSFSPLLSLFPLACCRRLSLTLPLLPASLPRS